jgi:hypothetical protein
MGILAIAVHRTEVALAELASEEFHQLLVELDCLVQVG